MNEIEIKQKIRDELSWNGFDEEVIEPLFQIVNTAFLAGQKQERERVREQAEKYWYSFCSAHKVTDPECNTCKHGSFDFAEFLSALEPKS